MGHKRPDSSKEAGHHTQNQEDLKVSEKGPSADRQEVKMTRH